MSTDLLLSLGHNSSAVAIVDGRIINGYEEERLTRIKSDSAFPINAIRQIGIEEYDSIYISHWDPFGNLDNMKLKHFNRKLLPTHKNIVTVDKNFTHHDCHMMSAKAFVGDEMPPSWTIVADGFGNFGETISIYNPQDELVNRVYGYDASLGLMYQYAVANLGMKMNEDEYKLLGYENSCSNVDKQYLGPIVLDILQKFTNHINNKRLFNDTDPLYKIEALVETQLMWDKILAPCERMKHLVAHVVQTALERILVAIIRKYNIDNVILVGGVFMNVKANYKVLEAIPGMLSVMPLCGDQGAPLGLYKRDNPDWQMPKNLCWGFRDIKPTFNRDRTEWFNNKSDMANRLLELLKEAKIVNIVWGNMEFGARALCRTSTIALPVTANVDYINKCNGRDTVMPMAPVVSEEVAYTLFDDMDRVVKSNHYMVLAQEYFQIKHDYRGAAHGLPTRDGYTGRPQVVPDDDKETLSIMGPALKEFGILINTSFNIHGVPIIFSNKDLIECIDYQQKHDNWKIIHNLILTNYHEEIK